MTQQHAPKIDDFVNELLGHEDHDETPSPAVNDVHEEARQSNTPQAPAEPAVESPGNPENRQDESETPPEPVAAEPAPAVPESEPATPAVMPPQVPVVPDAGKDDFPIDLEKWFEPTNSMEDETPAVPSLRCVSFTLQEQLYAAEVGSLLEVLDKAQIVPIPSMRAPVMGILNLRGSIVTVLDPAGLLGLPPKPDDDGQLIIADYQGEPVALRVDRVGEVISMQENEIQQSPRSAAHVRGLVAVNDEMLTLLDIHQLVAKAFPSPL